MNGKKLEPNFCENFSFSEMEADEPNLTQSRLRSFSQNFVESILDFYCVKIEDY